eukprot:767236-Hanusia_phi.AAC.2
MTEHKELRKFLHAEGCNLISIVIASAGQDYRNRIATKNAAEVVLLGMRQHPENKRFNKLESLP